ncbi:MAG: hypothetical protein RLZZ249_1373, partial [Actinomycetota bacterium]
FVCLQAGKLLRTLRKIGVINLIWLLNCLLTILFYPKGISTETGVSAEVFGIDIVHAVEFSKIGCF